jgi:hypothetical protein
MNDHDPTELKRLLKDTLPPLANTELRRDLWPAMLRRLETQAIRVPWWDWALLAAAAAVFVFFPGTIPALLYHL